MSTSPAARADAALDALGDPVRRLLVRLVAAGERPAGELVRGVQAVRPVSQPAVSQHLGVLRDAGLVTVRTAGTRRIYALDTGTVADVRAWFDDLVDPLAAMGQPLDALATEVARGRRAVRGPSSSPATDGTMSA
ncbi:ArsR/SmtB family transcription factor [Cellulomonas persica]|uniref:Putative transcriptional regulator, ArsR family protein n=1 Tax=Cellulomonas persica TaxID=76861 RepID=A0A510UT23_9CELL|nr:metalloregulator ArsR/SmtB family transcription factor [Cellulomonas persica]GEK16601.1 putative transcriptional regulator, ArsR family protein [Cellulomonas persica]